MNEDIMKGLGLGDFVERVRQGKCPTCSQPIVIKEFRDLLSLREFEISGMCQKCQDKFFTEPEEDVKRPKDSNREWTWGDEIKAIDED